MGIHDPESCLGSRRESRVNRLTCPSLLLTITRTGGNDSIEKPLMRCFRGNPTLRPRHEARFSNTVVTSLPLFS